MEAAAIIAERKARWRGFYDLTQPSPWLFLVHLSTDPAAPLPNPENEQARLDWALRRYETQMERLSWLDDDALPYLYVHTGTEIFAEAFGCRVHRPADNNPFAQPLIHQAAEVAGLRVPSLDTPCLARLFAMADYLRARAGADALFKLVDVQSPMDIAALIWDKNEFYPALREEPAAVRELAAKVRALLTAFLDEWFGRYGTEYIAHYPDYYMEGGLTLSEDEIGCVSPAMCGELFLPELRELSARYGGIGIHCCANARHQWAGLKTIPGLRMLNLIQPNEILLEAAFYFAGAAGQMHGWDMSEHEAMCRRLPREARLVLEVQAPNRKEAVKLAERMRKIAVKRA